MNQMKAVLRVENEYSPQRLTYALPPIILAKGTQTMFTQTAPSFTSLLQDNKTKNRKEQSHTPNWQPVLHD